MPSRIVDVQVCRHKACCVSSATILPAARHRTLKDELLLCVVRSLLAWPSCLMDFSLQNETCELVGCTRQWISFDAATKPGAGWYMTRHTQKVDLLPQGHYVILLFVVSLGNMCHSCFRTCQATHLLVAALCDSSRGHRRSQPGCRLHGCLTCRSSRSAIDFLD